MFYFYSKNPCIIQHKLDINRGITIFDLDLEEASDLSIQEESGYFSK
jgi:hypothetical protein